MAVYDALQGLLAAHRREERTSIPKSSKELRAAIGACMRLHEPLIKTADDMRAAFTAIDGVIQSALGRGQRSPGS